MKINLGKVKWNSKRAVKLYKSGKPVSQIAQALGYPKGHGQNRVAYHLIKEGVYTGKRKSA